MIRKKNHSSLVVPQINIIYPLVSENTLFDLFPNLKSLTPYPLSSSPAPQVEMRENGVVKQEVRGAAEMELDPHECLKWDENQINLSPATTSSIAQQKKPAFSQEQNDDEGCCINVEEEDTSRPFKPSIKIRKMDDDSIYISTIVMKEVSLTSTLFAVLEEEKLDIVFEDQYRTETKVAHNIQVRVQPGYDVDALETKLCLWARCNELHAS